ILITRKGSDVTASNLDESKKYTVGTQLEDYTETILKEKGFTKLDGVVDADGGHYLFELLDGRALDLLAFAVVEGGIILGREGHRL
ncbi:hypothetical protein ACCS53_38300, partial [Rhizobium ruizarguesonis]